MFTIGTYKKHKKFWILMGVSICVIVLVATIAISVWRSTTTKSVTSEVWLKIVTDKKTYAHGENVTYRIFIVNDKTENFTLINPSYDLHIYKKENGKDVYLYSVGNQINVADPPYKVILCKSEDLMIEDLWQPLDDSLTPLSSGEYILRINLTYPQPYVDIKGEAIIEIL